MKNILNITFILSLIAVISIGCNESKSQANKEMKNIMNENNPNLETATFGSGCFCCTEAIFERVNGVNSVYRMYSRVMLKIQRYKEVCDGTTDTPNAQINFDPAVVSYDELLEIFWKTIIQH
jgi:peptide-methionine (S)-S-oxide reductase